MQDPHDIGREWFGAGNYTVEYREFADGDTRTVIKHAVGHSATCYIQVQVWTGRREVWVEYYEGDVRRCRDHLTFSEFDPTADLAGYLW